MSEAPLIAMRQVRYDYPLAERPVFAGVDFELCAGQRVGLFGPNGCGKTTLLSVLMGLLPASGGEILHQGRAITDEAGFAALRREVGFLLQQADDQILFPTVLDDVAFGPLNLGLSPAEAAREARVRYVCRLVVGLKPRKRAAVRSRFCSAAMTWMKR